MYILLAGSTISLFMQDLHGFSVSARQNLPRIPVHSGPQRTQAHLITPLSANAVQWHSRCFLKRQKRDRKQPQVLKAAEVRDVTFASELATAHMAPEVVQYGSQPRASHHRFSQSHRCWSSSALNQSVRSRLRSGHP